MPNDLWPVVGVGLAILSLVVAILSLVVNVYFRGPRSDIRELRGHVSDLRERMARLEGPSFRELLKTGGDKDAGA